MNCHGSQVFALEHQHPANQFTSLTASSCHVCDLAAEQGVGQFAPTSTDEAPAISGERAGWEGIIGMEGTPTGDGRLIETNALYWDDDPLPLRYVVEDVGAHDGAQVVGRILSIERRDGGVLWGKGDFDLASEVGREAFRQVDEKLTVGVSMDLDDVSFEVRIAAEVLDELNSMMEGSEVEVPEPDVDGNVTVATIKADDEMRVTTEGRIRAATIVAIPAFAEAKITTTDTAPEAKVDSLVASGIPVEPPLEWFQNPQFSQITPLTVTDEGRVYGHIAAWGTCHTGHAQRGQCVTPPASMSGYSHFLTGLIRTADGTEVPVGHITLDTKHALESLNASSAAVHYDNTGSVVADVMAGEDSHGIWFAGALRPGLSDAKIRSLRAAPLSGDWRNVGGNLELVAMLGVNMPGFPIPRPAGLVASGRMMSLVASGMVGPNNATMEQAEPQFSKEDADYLRRLARFARESDVRDEATEKVAAKMTALRNERKVHAFARARKEGL